MPCSLRNSGRGSLAPSWRAVPAHRQALAGLLVVIVGRAAGARRGSCRAARRRPARAAPRRASRRGCARPARRCSCRSRRSAASRARRRRPGRCGRRDSARRRCAEATHGATPRIFDRQIGHAGRLADQLDRSARREVVAACSRSAFRLWIRKPQRSCALMVRNVARRSRLLDEVERGRPVPRPRPEIGVEQDVDAVVDVSPRRASATPSAGARGSARRRRRSGSCARTCCLAAARRSISVAVTPSASCSRRSARC